MAYKVKLSNAAEADAYVAYDYIRRLSPSRADRWLIELFHTVFTLSELPSRCPLIAEADEIGRPLRQLLFGQRTGIYRIIYDIQEVSEEGPRVSQ